VSGIGAYAGSRWAANGHDGIVGELRVEFRVGQNLAVKPPEAALDGLSELVL
jgi:hypothetical protein